MFNLHVLHTTLLCWHTVEVYRLIEYDREKYPLYWWKQNKIGHSTLLYECRRYPPEITPQIVTPPERNPS